MHLPSAPVERLRSITVTPMRLRIEANGSATKASMWDADADPAEWRTWAPHLTEVRADGPLRPGLEGEVRGWLGASARFHVTEVSRRGAGRGRCDPGRSIS